MDITLKSQILEVKQVLKKTQAKMFRDLKIGDRVQFSIPIEPAGSNRGTYASYIKAENLENKDYNYSSFNQMPRLLSYFEFEEVEY